MSLADWAASIAATLTTLSFLPQALHVIRTRDTQAISLMMYAMFVLGVAFWELFGVMTMQWPIIIANLVTLGLAGTILGLKVSDVLRKRGTPTGAE